MTETGEIIFFKAAILRSEVDYCVFNIVFQFPAITVMLSQYQATTKGLSLKISWHDKTT